MKRQPGAGTTPDSMTRRTCPSPDLHSTPGEAQTERRMGVSTVNLSPGGETDFIKKKLGS